MLSRQGRSNAKLTCCSYVNSAFAKYWCTSDPVLPHTWKTFVKIWHFSSRRGANADRMGFSSSLQKPWQAVTRWSQGAGFSVASWNNCIPRTHCCMQTKLSWNKLGEPRTLIEVQVPLWCHDALPLLWWKLLRIPTQQPRQWNHYLCQYYRCKAETVWKGSLGVLFANNSTKHPPNQTCGPVSLNDP